MASTIAAGASGRAMLIFPNTDPRVKRRLEEEQRRREWLAYQQDILARSHRLLAQIDIRQREIEKRRREIEDRAIRAGRWQTDLPTNLGGATLGLAGLGHLGASMVAPAR